MEFTFKDIENQLNFFANSYNQLLQQYEVYKKVVSGLNETNESSVGFYTTDNKKIEIEIEIFQTSTR